MSKQMQITVLVPVAKVHDACIWLEENGATAMMVKAVANGHAKTEAAPKTNGHDGRTVEKSKLFQAWIDKHAKGDFATKDLTEAWVATGWRREGLYNAIAKGVKLKKLKRLASGKYRRIA